MNKSVTSILVVLLIFLQANLWYGAGSFAEVWHLKQAISAQLTELAHLKKRNMLLDAKVSSLKGNYAVFEDRAREELGMIKRGETFAMILD